MPLLVYEQLVKLWDSPDSMPKKQKAGGFLPTFTFHPTLLTFETMLSQYIYPHFHIKCL